VPIALLAALHFGTVSLSNACRWEALRVRGRSRGEPSDADMNAAAQAIRRGLRKNRWRVRGAAPLRAWGPSGPELKRGRARCARFLLNHGGCAVP
jgi:hypothetical protein